MTRGVRGSRGGVVAAAAAEPAVDRAGSRVATATRHQGRLEADWREDQGAGRHLMERRLYVGTSERVALYQCQCVSLKHSLEHRVIGPPRHRTRLGLLL